MAASITSSGSTEVGSIEIKEIILSNHRGDSKDIKDMVGFIKLIESIELLGIVAEIGIKDESNFFELFELSGHERLQIKLEQNLFQDNIKLAQSRIVNLDLIVTEYPDFERPADNQMQVYSITAVARHLFLSPLKKISRAVNGDVIDIIQSILKKDLGFDPNLFHIQGQPNSKFRGILPWDSPIPHIKNLTKKLSDTSKTPYWVFQRISGAMNFLPLSWIASQDTFRTYVDQVTDMEVNDGSWEAQLLNLSRIHNMSSTLGLSALDLAIEGVWASETHYVDTLMKTIRRNDFQYDQDVKAQNTIGQRLAHRPDFDPALTEMRKAHLDFILQSRLQHGGLPGMGELNEANRHTNRALTSMLDLVSHDISVAGDLFLNPGRVIELRIPKATAPENWKSYTGKSTEEFIDKSISGRYLVTGTRHTIEGTKYTTQAVIKKDII